MNLPTLSRDAASILRRICHAHTYNTQAGLAHTFSQRSASSADQKEFRLLETAGQELALAGCADYTGGAYEITLTLTDKGAQIARYLAS